MINKTLSEESYLLLIRLNIKFYESFPFGKEFARGLKPLFYGAYMDHRLSKVPNDEIEIEREMLREIRKFYSFLFRILPIKEFVPIKTKREIMLYQRLKSRQYHDIREGIGLSQNLGKSVCKRFFAQNKDLIANPKKLIKYFTKQALDNFLFSVYLSNCSAHESKVYELSEQISLTEEKLKRNRLKDGGLDLYKEIIKEIVRVESDGYKAPIQSICTKIASEKNLKTDLRKAFDGWKKRNPELFKKLYDEISGKPKPEELWL